MLKKINESLHIVNNKNKKIVVTIDNNGMIVGDYEIWGYAEYLCGNASKITGNVGDIYGDVSRIRGNVSGLRGDIIKITGDVSNIRGYVGYIEGDVTGLKGDVSKIYGDATGVSGNIDEAIAEYLKKHNLTELEEDKIDINLLID